MGFLSKLKFFSNSYNRAEEDKVSLTLKAAVDTLVGDTAGCNKLFFQSVYSLKSLNHAVDVS